MLWSDAYGDDALQGRRWTKWQDKIGDIYYYDATPQVTGVKDNGEHLGRRLPRYPRPRRNRDIDP
ncbi:MAG: hypothetical protein SNJ52_03015 [Verrucomicrobiia bacterium]